ncbi:MAG: preprotein translocase subunit SecG [bacterium]|jgi:preprotein translocase subunit SecG|nr:preprotein translocase subunit SecG [bacterium]
MGAAFQIASIIMSVLMVILIMLQVKGGALSSMLGGDAGGGIARTRRGLEKTLFQFTVGLSTAFLLVCILAVVTAG